MYKLRASLIVLASILLLATMAYPAGYMLTYFATVSASSTNTNHDIGILAGKVTFVNDGPNTVFINVDGAGVAATTGSANIKLPIGEKVTLTAAAGASIQNVGLICADTETASVRVYAIPLLYVPR